MIQNCTVGQGRGSPNKQFVFLCGNYTYKGPYPSNSEKPENIQNRTKYLKEWNATDILFPIDIVKDHRGSRWIVYDNLMKDLKLEEVLHRESFSNYEYYKIGSGGLPDLLEFVKRDKKYFFENYDTFGLILSYVYLYILGSGDAGLYNVLIDDHKHKMYIIDYDESRSVGNKNSQECMFYFTRAPSKDIQWFENTGYHYYNIANHLDQLKQHYPELNENFDKTIQLLDYWYNDWYRRFGSTFSIPSFGKQEIEDVTTEGEVGAEGEVRTEGEVRAEGEVRTEGNYGHMYAAHRNAKIYSGYDFGVAKSALQKYIRRGIVDKALMVATEMYRILEVLDRDGSKANALFTNLRTCRNTARF